MAATHIPPVNERIRSAAGAIDTGRGHQSSLAEQLGVSRNAVSSWFAGRSTPEPQHWTAIAGHLGIEPGELQMIAADYFAPGIKRHVELLERTAEWADAEIDRLRDAYRRTTGAEPPRPSRRPAPRP